MGYKCYEFQSHLPGCYDFQSHLPECYMFYSNLPDDEIPLVPEVDLSDLGVVSIYGIHKASFNTTYIVCSMNRETGRGVDLFILDLIHYANSESANIYRSLQITGISTSDIKCLIGSTNYDNMLTLVCKDKSYFFETASLSYMGDNTGSNLATSRYQGYFEDSALMGYYEKGTTAGACGGEVTDTTDLRMKLLEFGALVNESELTTQVSNTVSPNYWFTHKQDNVIFSISPQTGDINILLNSSQMYWTYAYYGHTYCVYSHKGDIAFGKSTKGYSYNYFANEKMVAFTDGYSQSLNFYDRDEIDGSNIGINLLPEAKTIAWSKEEARDFTVYNDIIIHVGDGIPTLYQKTFNNL